MKLKAYGLLAWFSLKETLTYWKDAFLHVFFSIFRVVIQLSAWYALYRSVDFAPVMGRDFDTMVTYQLLMMVVREFTFADGVAAALEARMASGEIAMDFLRPVAPRGIIVAKTWGDKLLFLLSAVLTFVLAVVMVGGIQPPASAGTFFLFLLSLCLGYLINLMFELVMATFAFWFVAVGTLRWFIDFFTLAMSGVMIPLWLLPNWLQAIARALPFQAVTYIPMQVYLGGMPAPELAKALALQIFWIIGLFAVQQWLWKKGTKRIVVLGG